MMHIYYMRKAIEQAEIAAKNGEVPVGAILCIDGLEFASHNAPISTADASAHAEMRVIRAACAAIGNYRLNKATLYVTLEPCCMCAGTIVQARIGHVVYGAADPKAGAVVSVYQILSDPRLNHQPRITGGILAEPCGELLRQFFRERRKQSKP